MALQPCIVNAASMMRSSGHGLCSLCKQPIAPGFRHLDLEVPTERRYWEFLDSRPVHTPGDAAGMDGFLSAMDVWAEIRRKYEVKIVLGLAYDHAAERRIKPRMAPLKVRR